jgi:hypothetical protein
MPGSSSSAEPSQQMQQDPDFEIPVRLAREMGLPIPRHINHPIVQHTPNKYVAAIFMKLNFQGTLYQPDYRHPTEMPACLKTAQDKKNFRRAVKDNTFNIARGPCPNCVPIFTMGRWGHYKCVNCSALFFENEVKLKKDLESMLLVCCQRGKVKVDPPPEYPPELRRLLDLHMDSLRHLNSALSVAAYKARRVPMAGWPFIYKTQGQIHVEMNHADPLPDADNEIAPPAHLSNPRNRRDIHRRDGAQLSAFIDPALAMHEILQRPGGHRLDRELLAAMLTFLHDFNPIYRSYRRMYEVIAEKEAQEGVSVEVTLVFQNPGKDKSTLREHTHRVPIETNEVAALFDVSGTPETPSIYVMKEGTPFEVLPTNPYRDAFLYPVMYVFGQRGWHSGMKHVGPNATEIRNNVTLRDYTVYALLIFSVIPAS